MAKQWACGAVCLGMLLATPAARAEDPGKTGASAQPPAAEKSIYDKIWALPQLHEDDTNPYIEEFDLTGRFQMDYFDVESDKGDTNFVEIRRFRLGADSWWAARHLELKVTLDTDLHSYHGDDVFYKRMTDLFAKVHVNDAFNFRVGKFEPHFGYDREFTDNLHKFFERSFYDDQLIGGNDYVAGVEVTGKVDHWGYLAAVYSDNVDREFGQFDGGESFQVEISCDFAKALAADKALAVFDYLHADGKNGETNVFTNYRNAAATYFDYQKQRFGIVSQIGYLNGVSSKGDTYQVMVMPSYLLTETLELVTRYQLGLGTEDDGITTLNRQEKTVGKFTGDTYNAGYVGLNYYLYGQKLKLIAGEQYANLGGGTGANADYSGWTTLVGMRMFF